MNDLDVSAKKSVAQIFNCVLSTHKHDIVPFGDRMQLFERRCGFNFIISDAGGAPLVADHSRYHSEGCRKEYGSTNGDAEIE